MTRSRSSASAKKAGALTPRSVEARLLGSAVAGASPRQFNAKVHHRVSKRAAGHYGGFDATLICSSRCVLNMEGALD